MFILYSFYIIFTASVCIPDKVIILIQIYIFRLLQAHMESTNIKLFELIFEVQFEVKCVKTVAKSIIK